jgi:Na+/proline symporter/signal transduction histidine kinase
MDNQILLLFAFLYAAILFSVAWCVQRWPITSRPVQSALFSLSLAVYCSSWTFLGAVGRAVETGWGFVPIYLGPILLFIFGWRFLRHLLLMSSRNKVTSIADFIGSRYGKSQVLAAVVTLVAVAGSLPYIALQLKAVSLMWSTINAATVTQGLNNLGLNDQGLNYQGLKDTVATGSSLITALVMAWFAILFGTRVIDGTRRHQGVIASIALESLVKLVAFLAVGILAVGVLLREEGAQLTAAVPLASLAAFDLSFLTQSLLGVMAIICLPRQFHVMAVEYRSSRDIRTARWVFPGYLLLFSLLVIPIALAGQRLFSTTNVQVDTIVLLLPMAEGSTTLTALAFIGALSAATGMVVIATLTLSIMISNELVVPLWLRLGSRTGHGVSDLGGSLRMVRRLSIVSLLLLAWSLELNFSESQGLAAIGLISFAAAAQLMPAIWAALNWRGGHRHGVLAGLCLGVSLWFYCLLLPALMGDQHPLVVEGPWHVSWLSPVNLLGTGFMDTLSHGVFWSLLLNSLAFYWFSTRSRFNTLDLRQAMAFTQLRQRFSLRQQDFELTDLQVRQLQSLLRPLLGSVREQQLWQEFEQRLGHRLLPHDKAPRFVVQTVEESMASIIGAVSAHRAIELIRRQQPVQIDDFVSLMGGRSRQLQFSQELLQTTLETIPQGISVVDDQMQLVAWNSRYQQLFGFPARLLYVGCPIDKVYQYNAERGYLGDGSQMDVKNAVEKRLLLLREGREYRIERRLPNSLVIEIRGTPMVNGGYVTTYTDITDYQTVLDELAQAKNRLEERVLERTAALSQANASLKQENSLRARIEHELGVVHTSKSRFLAAASHDLLQPINAARLFVATLQHKTGSDSDIAHEVNHIDGALASAENLISSMREIARLDSGKLIPKRENFVIGDQLRELSAEFNVLASNNDLAFHWVNSNQWVYTDRHLLRRVLQNFLSNALRYTRRGKVLLGCRRDHGQLVIEVWDTGPGVHEQDAQRIFDEFERLSDGVDHSGQKGLGLGLSIANRIAQLLGHPLNFNSWPGAGSVFRISVPLGAAQQPQPDNVIHPSTELHGLKVLCIDNETRILAGMQSLLETWGCQALCAPSLGDALQRWSHNGAPDIVLADYHLDAGETGLDVLAALSLHWDNRLPAIVISANNSDELRQEVSAAGCLFLPKPVQPGALRASMRSLARRLKG